MNKSGWVTLCALVCSLAAAMVSYRLLVKHVTGATGPAWFEAGCREGGGEGGADCAAVLASPYSYFPSKHDDAKRGVHIPVALLGLIYYSAIAVWLIGVGRPDEARRRVHFVPLFWIAGGLIGSAFYTYVMFSRLEEWCPWCMLTHGLNVLVAVCLILMWPRASRKCGTDIHPDGPSKEDRSARSAETRPNAHPLPRLVIMTVLAVLFVVVGEYQLLAKQSFKRVAVTNKRGFDQCLAALNKLRGDADLLVKGWERGHPYKIKVRPDDPVRGNGSAGADAMELVLFSDFQCPACKRLTGFIDEAVVPLFAGELRVVWKHYPLHTDCNPVTKAKIHKHACRAAKIAEAARMVGGNAAFWSVHDILYARQDELKRGALTLQSVAAEAGLDPVGMRMAAQSDEVKRRIVEDARKGRAIGLVGTPSVYLDGRLIDPVTREAVGFWDRIAEMYWKKRGLPRPVTAAAKGTPATPDTPNPKASE